MRRRIGGVITATEHTRAHLTAQSSHCMKLTQLFWSNCQRLVLTHSKPLRSLGTILRRSAFFFHAVESDCACFRCAYHNRSHSHPEFDIVRTTMKRLGSPPHKPRRVSFGNFPLQQCCRAQAVFSLRSCLLNHQLRCVVCLLLPFCLFAPTVL